MEKSVSKKGKGGAKSGSHKMCSEEDAVSPVNTDRSTRKLGYQSEVDYMMKETH